MAHVFAWICNALERGVLEMRLSFKKKNKNLSLPSELLTSKTLVKLTLGTEIYLGEFPPNGLDSYTGDVTIGLFQVKKLHVVGYRGTDKELQHLKSLLAGTECIPRMRVEFPEDVVVDSATINQTRLDKI
ncbi:unnamed protein product [Eruca vesicaria subsp. sativa]|uniref:FBD domain-containing protein n=1 Tax=Eruca vesicaria subsp. sativa TaxID=29727 RepID=A0ABC8J8S7_ERUVS|nr:unnamed protein product [Eruca vesicaria subsp. sativa]